MSDTVWRGQKFVAQMDPIGDIEARDKAMQQ